MNGSSWRRSVSTSAASGMSAMSAHTEPAHGITRWLTHVGARLSPGTINDVVSAHVDLDCFFVQVAQHADPRLGTGAIGVLAKSAVVSASYEARAAGVRAGMAASLAKTLCPTIVFANVDRDAVVKASDAVFASLRSHAGVHGWEVSQVGLDEAYVSGTSWAALVPRLARWREECRTHLGYVCSIGVGPSRVVAKIASSAAKPDGFLPVSPDRAVAWIGAQPVGEVPGVGPRALERLQELGVRSVADVLKFDRELLTIELGANLASLVTHAARAEDQPVRTAPASLPARSMSISQTFNPAVGFESAAAELDTMCGRLSSRLFQERVGCATLTVGVRLDQRPFTSRSVRAQGAFTGFQLAELARAALVTLVADKSQDLRMLSVTCDVTTAQQPSLFVPEPSDLLVPGAVVHHPVFGVGVIDTQMAEPGLLRVRFSDRTRDVLSSSVERSSIN